jgi:hypothetical protein
VTDDELMGAALELVRYFLARHADTPFAAWAKTLV